MRGKFAILELLVGFILLTRAFAAEKKGERMAGAVSDDPVSATARNQDVTLTGVNQTPPTALAWRSNQIGNQNPIKELAPRASTMIADGIAGVSFRDIYSTPTDAGWNWSPSWLIAGELDSPRRDSRRCFSSQLNRSANAEEWVQIELDKSEDISRVALWPRNKAGIGFPIDFQIWCRDRNKPWVKVVDEKNFKLEGRSFPLEFSFKPMEARFVKIIATRLRKEGNVYYFQLNRVGVYNTKNENVALAAKGAEALASNPLTVQTYDYDSVYDNLSKAGVKWTIISLNYNTILKRQQENKSPLPPRLIKNIDNLNKHGVKAFVRVGCDPDWVLEGAEGIKKYLNILEPTVKELKGKVGVWILLNEENMHNMYRYLAAMKRVPGATAEMWKQSYVNIVSAGADAIHKIDPDVPIEVETALFDFGWTEDILKLGLKDKIDMIGVHVYKESPTEKIMPEMVSTFIKDGSRKLPKEQPFKTYMEEIEAYRKLLDSINPKIQINVTETCVNALRQPWLNRGMAVSEKSQAKFLARLYWIHYVYGFGPTCWWGFFRTTFGDNADWGLMDPDGRPRDAWFALQNVSAVMDKSFKVDTGITFAVTPQYDKLFHKAFKNAQGEILIPYWAMVPPRDDNTGVAVDIKIGGVEIKSAEVIDMFSGTTQKLDFQKSQNAYDFPKMVIRDYPLVIKIHQ